MARVMKAVDPRYSAKLARKHQPKTKPQFDVGRSVMIPYSSDRFITNSQLYRLADKYDLDPNTTNVRKGAQQWGTADA
eukprot:1382274-Amorphochlora_amoeboformis.AAC.1